MKSKVHRRTKKTIATSEREYVLRNRSSNGSLSRESAELSTCKNMGASIHRSSQHLSTPVHSSLRPRLEVARLWLTCCQCLCMPLPSHWTQKSGDHLPNETKRSKSIKKCRINPKLEQNHVKSSLWTSLSNCYLILLLEDYQIVDMRTTLSLGTFSVNSEQFHVI